MFTSLHAAVLAPFAAACLIPWLYRRLGGQVGRAVTFVPLALFLYLLSFAGPVGRGEAVVARLPWVPSLGLDFTLRITGFSWLFALLISGIGLLVVVYSRHYLAAREDLGKFYAYILLFMGSMLGLVLSANLGVLYVFWELTSVSSFLLIGFWHTRSESRDGALKSLLVTVTGGLALLAGFVLLFVITGTFDLGELAARADLIRAHPLYPAILVLVLWGAFSKSAQIPFYIWLPGAMAAPTPVSAYLHSATMVKAGLFLVATVLSVLGGTPAWFYAVALAGIVTMVGGAYMAIGQRDLKALLALSTVSQLGLIMTTFAYGTVEATSAGVFHLFNHATFKGALFMLAGIVDHETGTRDVALLGGLRRKMPATAFLMALGALAMAGLPLLSGFVSKEMIFLTMLEAPVHGSAIVWLVPVLAVLGSVFTVVYSLILAHRIFFGPLTGQTPKKPHEAPWGMLLAPALLVAIVAVVGVYPAVVQKLVVAAGTAAVLGIPVSVKLALWHGFNWALAMSLGAIVAGGLLYLSLGRVLAIWASLRTRYHLNALYDAALVALDLGSRRVTNLHMTGFLRDYVVYVMAAVVLLGGLTMARAGALALPRLDLAPVSVGELATLAVMVAAALGTVLTTHRLAAILAMGLVGLMSALLFVFWQAPDLALTQLAVEAVAIIPLLLAFARLPRMRPEGLGARVGWINGAVAALSGLTVTWMALGANGRAFFDSIAGFFVENSKPLGGGKNIVNVILVDFRALDTLGEITVLAIAAVGVFALVALRAGERGERP